MLKPLFARTLSFGARIRESSIDTCNIVHKNFPRLSRRLQFKLIAANAVPLKTKKHLEASSYGRSNFASESLDLNDQTERLLTQYLDPTEAGK